MPRSVCRRRPGRPGCGRRRAFRGFASDRPPAGRRGWRKLDVGDEQLAVKAADDQRLVAPVELEGFAECELERDVRRMRRLGAVPPPAPDVLADTGVAASETQRPQLPEQRQRRVSVSFRSPRVGFEPLLQAIFIRRQGSSPSSLRRYLGSAPSSAFSRALRQCFLPVRFVGKSRLSTGRPANANAESCPRFMVIILKKSAHETSG